MSRRTSSSDVIRTTLRSVRTSNVSFQCLNLLTFFRYAAVPARRGRARPVHRTFHHSEVHSQHCHRHDVLRGLLDTVECVMIRQERSKVLQLTFFVDYSGSYPARTALSITALLALITQQMQSSNVNVSYIMALNIWMLICIAFVFLSLIGIFFHYAPLAQLTNRFNYRISVQRDMGDATDE